MNLSVTNTATRLTLPQGALVILQNLGSGAVYVDQDDSVSSTTSFKLASGDKYQFPRTAGSIWVISDGAADLRILVA
jgi:hypothetical protein